MGESGPDAAAAVYDEIRAERERAHAKHGDTSMESQPVDALLRLAILTEEIGEVAKEFNEARHRGEPVDLALLRKELIQVAAIAAGWADNITASERNEGMSNEHDAVVEQARVTALTRAANAIRNSRNETRRGEVAGLNAAAEIVEQMIRDGADAPAAPLSVAPTPIRSGVREQWRTTNGTVLERAPSGPIMHHSCGCITGWDDVNESCVLRRCETHGAVVSGE